MAIDIALSASVDVGEGAKSLKSLKQEFKETQKELEGLTQGSREYVKVLEKLGGVKDQIADLNEEIAAFDGGGSIAATRNIVGGLASGFQAAQGAAALFGGESKELEKTLLKVQAATAFAEGIKGVEGLGQSFKALGQVLQSTAIGQKVVTAAQWLWNAAVSANPIALIVIALAALVAGMKLFAAASEDAAAKQERLNKLLEEHAKIIENDVSAIKKKLQIAIDASERELALMKAQGATAEEIHKKELEILRQKEWALSYIAGFRGDLNDEEKKQQADLLNQSLINDAAYIKSKEDKAAAEKKINDKSYEDNRAAALAARRKQLEEEWALEAEFHSIQNTFLFEQKLLEDEQKLIDQDAKFAAMDAETEKYFEESEKRKAKLAEEKAAEQQSVNTSLAIAKASNDSMIALSDLYFTVKRGNLQKGSAEDLKQAKKQFKINKALAIQSAVISGIQGVVNALSAQSVIPEPFGTILKVATAVGVGIAAAANVAKISSTQFSETGGGGGAVASVSAGAPSVSAPSINAPNTTSTTLNPDGSVRSQEGAPQPTIKAQVVETEMTGTQKRVSGIETNAKI